MLLCRLTDDTKELKRYIEDISLQVDTFSDLILKNLETIQEENKQLTCKNKQLLEEYSNKQSDLSKKEKEYLEIKNNLLALVDQQNDLNRTTQQDNRTRSNNPSSSINRPTSSSTNTQNITLMINNHLKTYYSKAYSEFEEKVKSSSSFDLKTNHEDIVILLEAIKFLQQSRKNDVNSILDKQDNEFLSKITSEYSLVDEEEDIIGERIIEMIEKSVNQCHQSGKIKEVEISQVTNTEYKFDNLKADFIIENDKLKVKSDDCIGFDEWLVKNFSLKKPKLLDSRKNNLNLEGKNELGKDNLNNNAQNNNLNLNNQTGNALSGQTGLHTKNILSGTSKSSKAPATNKKK